MIEPWAGQAKLNSSPLSPAWGGDEASAGLGVVVAVGGGKLPGREEIKLGGPDVLDVLYVPDESAAGLAVMGGAITVLVTARTMTLGFCISVLVLPVGVGVGA